MESEGVLIVAAHPDDEVLGCGGTIRRLAGEGRVVYTAILGEGITSRYGQRDQADKGLLEALRLSARQAAALLKVKEVFFYDLPDNRFDTVPLLDMVKIVEGLIRRLRPGLILTHHPGDLNVDHGLTFRAVLTAARPLSGSPVKEVRAFEVPSATEWSFQRLGKAFAPNLFVDVSETLEVKIGALAFYEGELRGYPHPRSPEAIRNLACRWGAVAGVRAAEAFELIRRVE